jgi:hypothetical protein
MIELAPVEYDDADFLSLAQRVVNGAVTALEPREVFMVQTDNWFDWKWLGFWSVGRHKELCVPPFNPNRIRSEKRFIWDMNGSGWTIADHTKPLHVRQPGRCSEVAQPVDRWSKSAAFFWYSGNTTTNGAGSLMLYLSGAENYAWYASFTKAEEWTLHGQRGIAPRELETFEERGRELELVPK